VTQPMVTTRGIGHLYIETHDWAASRAFWEGLGFTLEYDTGHGSGQFVAANGTRLFVAEQSPEDPVATSIYLSVDDADASTTSASVVFPWAKTHWGTQVMSVRDLDGRLIRLESPAP
jgi:catechol 2,3-dioxygenase-like lactoylglutathione lyase family enzyme